MIAYGIFLVDILLFFKFYRNPGDDLVRHLHFVKILRSVQPHFLVLYAYFNLSSYLPSAPAGQFTPRVIIQYCGPWPSYVFRYIIYISWNHSNAFNIEMEPSLTTFDSITSNFSLLENVEDNSTLYWHEPCSGISKHCSSCPLPFTILKRSMTS